MAEGGINAALNTKGEDDSTQEHYEDTIKSRMQSGRSKRSLEYDTGGTGSGKVASQHRSAV